MGIVSWLQHALRAAGKPDLLFLTRTALAAAEVRKRYERGAEEGWESDRLLFFPRDHRRLDGGARGGGEALRLTPVTACALACALRHLVEPRDAGLRAALEAAGVVAAATSKA